MITYTEAEILNSPYTSYVQVPYNELHNHTFWEIFIILNGNCNHTVNGKTSLLSAGNVFFLRPIKDKHYFNNKNNEEFYRHRDVYITDSDMKTWCDMISSDMYEELLKPNEPVSFNISSSMLKYIEEILMSPNFNLPNNSTILKNIHFAVAIDLLTAYLLTKLPPSQPNWLNGFVEDLKNPDNFIYSIEELTAKIPYSHGYICREFKKHMNQTIVSFFNTQKINHASFLLMNSTLKILDISNIVGYTSPKNFINQFTKTFSLSPSAWRAKNQLLSKK